MAASALKRRGRGRGRRAGRIAEINVTPFVDVMLVLLIVFMVTAPLLTVGVPVELPKTEAKQLAADETPLTITVRADGVVYLQETEVAEEDLVAKLEALAREGLQSRIFIRGDNAASYGTVARVMAKINAAGYRNIGLVTDTLDREQKKT
ncbi:MAG: protein TolR [Hyphomonadaceae bacterium]|nr:protein TolR [Hyphomonadaceae bacterium]